MPEERLAQTDSFSVEYCVGIHAAGKAATGE